MVQALLQFGMFPTFDGCDFDNADCIVFWGSNSVWTEPTYTSGQVGRSRDRGAKLIVIDPFFEHPLAAKADCFLGVRPGSDTYVAYRVAQRHHERRALRPRVHAEAHQRADAHRSKEPMCR